MKKKLLALLLAVVMVIGMLPVTAAASSEQFETITFVNSETTSSEHFNLESSDNYDEYWMVGDGNCHETITIFVKPGNNLMITKIEAIVTLHSDDYQNVTVSSGVKQETSGVAEGATVHINEINAASIVIGGTDNAQDIGFRNITVYYTEVATHTHGEGESAVTFEKKITTEDELKALFSNGGSGYLADDIATEETMAVASDKTVNLCLNGHVIKMTGTGSVITVPANATLNLYDCNTTTKHYFTVDETGLWTLTNEETTNVVTGGVITGGSADEGGGVLVDGGVFSMYGGNIVGNKATSGGGICNKNTFTMYDGGIVGNTAKNGGGIYTLSITTTGSEETVNILTGGTVTGNTATGDGGGMYYQGEECFAAGTPITMADGSQKPIETLKIGDVVRVFDHDTGTISTAKLFELSKYPEKHSGAVTLHFSHGIDLTVVYGHSFFDKTANKYVAVTRDNVDFYVGHDFYNVDNGRWEKLIGYDFLDGEVDTYIITSEKHLNCVANGMLSNEDGFYTMLTNIFEYGDGLKINAEKKADDLKRYGLFGYEELQYVSREVYNILNLQYLNVALGKGMVTKEALQSLEAYWAAVDPELLCDTTVQQSIDEVGETCFVATAKSVQNSDPLDSGVYLGGTIKIIDNFKDTSGIKAANNLYLTGSKTVTLGTGTNEDGNGVAVPSTMTVGVTMQAPGQFTAAASGAGAAKGCFTSDNEDYIVSLNEDDDYLELVKHDLKVKKLDGSGNKIAATEGDVNDYVWDGNTLTILEDGLIVSGETATESIVVDLEVSTLTLSGVTIAPEDSGTIGTGIHGQSHEKDLTITLVGENQIGNTVTGEADASDYFVETGIYYSKNITFIGTGSLTIYDQLQGIQAGGNVVFDEKFSGTLTIDDYGTAPVCAIRATGNVELSGGTFDIRSHYTNGIYADGNVTIDNAKNVSIVAPEKAIYAGNGDVTIKNSKVAIHAGDNGIECKTLTIEGADTEVYSVGGTDDNGGYGLEIAGGANALTVKGGSVKFTGDEAAVCATDEAFTVSLPTGVSFKGNIAKDTFTGLQEVTLTYSKTANAKLPYIGENVAKSVALTVPKPSSGGGSSSSTYTVPVSGDKTSVKVQATISGSTATVKEIKDADLAKVADAKTVEIDLSGLGKNVDTAKIPTTTVEKIAEQGGMSVKLSTATVTFDTAATQEIAAQADGKTIELVVDDIKNVSLNAVQKEAVGKLDTALIIDAYLVSGGERLCSESKGGFGGGKATVALPFEIKNNRTAANYSVFYVDDAGNLERLAAKYDAKLGAFVFDIEHFSNYVVAYDENGGYANCPKDATCPISRFTDTKADFWWHDGIHYCVENGMMNGVTATEFAPNATLTRGMVVTVLWRLDNSPVANYAMSFKDVPAGQWYTEAVRWAQSVKVVEGYDEASFGPNDNVTREQLAAILYRYAVLKGVDTNKFTENTNTLSHNDVFTVSDWATSGMHFCIAAGVVNGDNYGNLNPQSTATRAEAAAMFQRFSEKVVK